MSTESESKAANNEGQGERDVDFSTLGKSKSRSDPSADVAGATADSESDAKVEKLTQEIATLRQEVADHKDKYLRALAELENYKKRAIKERSELIKYQGERILADLVEVLDNLGLALKYKESDPEKLLAGLEMVHKLFVDTLARWDVRAESGLGKDFDPNKHEALSKVAVDDAKPGTIISEFKMAYMYKDRLLRPGSVVVAVEKEPAKAEESNEEGDGDDEELDLGDDKPEEVDEE